MKLEVEQGHWAAIPIHEKQSLDEYVLWKVSYYHREINEYVSDVMSPICHSIQHKQIFCVIMR